MANQLKTFIWLVCLTGFGCTENTNETQNPRCLFDEECQAPSVCHPQRHTCTAPAADASVTDQTVDAQRPDLEFESDSAMVTLDDASIESPDSGVALSDASAPTQPDTGIEDAARPTDATPPSPDTGLDEGLIEPADMMDADATTSADMSTFVDAVEPEN